MALRAVLLYLLLSLAAARVSANDLWVIDSTSSLPGGPPLSSTDSQCLPAGGMEPTQAMSDMGSCSFLSKTGTASAMRFSLDCRMSEMPAELGSILVDGDARLSGDHFDMRYTIHMHAAAGAPQPGGDLTMTGTVDAHRTGACTGR